MREEVFRTRVVSSTRAGALTKAIGLAAVWWDVPVSNCTAEVIDVEPYIIGNGQVFQWKSTIEVRLVADL